MKNIDKVYELLVRKDSFLNEASEENYFLFFGKKIPLEILSELPVIPFLRENQKIISFFEKELWKDQGNNIGSKTFQMMDKGTKKIARDISDIFIQAIFLMEEKGLSFVESGTKVGSNISRFENLSDSGHILGLRMNNPNVTRNFSKRVDQIFLKLSKTKRPSSRLFTRILKDLPFILNEISLEIINGPFGI